MKKVFIRSIGKQVVLVPREQLRFKSHGRNFSIPRHLKALAKTTPTPPATWDFSQGEKLQFPILGNDTYGDCYYAAIAHGSQCYTGNSSTECSYDVNALEQRYLSISGGDNGLDDSTALSEWEGGIVGPAGPRKILDHLTVDPSDLASCLLAFWAFGGGVWTCSLLDAWLNNTNPGSIWDATGQADPNNGHAMFLTGRNAKGNWDVRTWGISPPVQVTDAGVKAADSELLVAFSLDQFRSDGTSAFTGLSYDAMAQLWQTCGGQSLPPSPFGPPAPTPPTPTPPTPTPPTPTPTPAGGDITVTNPISPGSYLLIPAATNFATPNDALTFIDAVIWGIMGGGKQSRAAAAGPARR